jgi:glucuronoarabinoxylan endo-1,4-beta-xylanase
LLGGGNGLAYTQPGFGGVTNQEIFNFANGPVTADQIVLGADRRYAVEFWAPATNTAALNLMRTAATPVDAQAGGQAMSGTDFSGSAQRLTLAANGQAGGSPRTFALALYGYMTNAPYTVNANPPIIITVPPVTNGACRVDWNEVHQRIDGFGASSAWRSSWTTTLADLLFSTNNGIVYSDTKGATTTNNGIGLSLLRTRIAPGGTTVENPIMQYAQSRGARVWSTPWSPAIQFKNNGSVNGGGFLGTPLTYQLYANQLAGYVANMRDTYGVNLYAISVQNEPDANVTTYESCNWSAQQIHDFVPYLYGALAASNVAATQIMLPESQNWPDYSNLTVTAMSDPSVAADVGIVADHNYDGANGPTTLTKNTYGKALWETEVSLLSGSDASIANGVYYAQRIHLFLTVAQVNAWHYWWLIPGNSSGNEGLMDTNAAPVKRMFTLGQFSRFVRPNYYRIGATNQGNGLASAYKDSLSPAFAIVAVNPNSYAIEQTFTLTNFAAGSVTPWITSSNLSLASQSAVALSNSSFFYELPPMSVITFAGRADRSPTNISLSAASVRENQPAGTVVGALATADPDIGDTFTYSLVIGSGSSNNSYFSITSNILYTAAILDALVQTNCSIRVRSTDAAGLWADKVFNLAVILDPQARRVVSAVRASDGNVTLTFAGVSGYNYRVQAATNLSPPVAWVTLTNNYDGKPNFFSGPTGFWTNTDLNATNFQSRFYRTIEP